MGGSEPMNAVEARWATRQDLREVTTILIAEFAGRLPAGTVIRCVARAREQFVGFRGAGWVGSRGRVDGAPAIVRAAARAPKCGMSSTVMVPGPLGFRTWPRESPSRPSHLTSNGSSPGVLQRCANAPVAI